MNVDHTVSLCMIVRDEADHIEKCLRSVRDVVDEIIVVNTESEDETGDICRELGAKVYDYKWNDHFAEARNESIKHATGDWILYMDADEVLDASNAKDLKKILREAEESILQVEVRNYVGKSMEENSGETFIYYQPRLFRNNLGIQFEGRIHETLTLPKSLNSMKYADVPITIHHYGYLEDIVEKRNKPYRNVTLLQMEHGDEESDPWIGYHLANELYRMGHFSDAFEFINDAIFRFMLQGQKPPSLLYRLKYAILMETGNIEGAYPAIEKAIELYPDYVDLHFCKGVLLYEKEEYKEALETFEKCLELGEDHKQYLVLKGVGSFRAEEYKEKCLQKLQ